MTTHLHLARRPHAANVVPSAYATAPSVHWRRTTVSATTSRIDLDLSKVVPTPAQRSAAGRAGAPAKTAASTLSRHAADAGAETGRRLSGTAVQVGVLPVTLRDGMRAALACCDQTTSSGTLIHLRLDALPRWLDLAHSQDPSPAELAAASYGQSGHAATPQTHPEAARDLLDALSQRLSSALPDGSLVQVDASGQAWILIHPVSSSAAAIGWARHAMHLLSPGTHRRSATSEPASPSGVAAGPKSPELPLDIAGGLCLFPTDATDIDHLLAAASAASAQARRQGHGHCQLYSREITARSREDLDEGRALAAALGSGGLELSLQGRADLRNGALCAAQVQLSWPRRIGDRSDVTTRPHSAGSGAEAPVGPSGRAPITGERRLANRSDPGGLVGGHLEALARQHGLAEALGRELLGRTCAQLRRWCDAGYAVPRLSLRLPAELLAHGDFAIELLDLLGRHRLPGNCLALELGQDSLAALRGDTAHLLDSAGVALIADAARVDLVSLTACRHLRVSALVVDLADLGDITVSRSPARTTLLALASLAHGMEMKLIAKSVDHETELDVLNGTVCDDYQGAVLARPLPARIWTSLLGEPAAAQPGKDTVRPPTSLRAASAVSA